VKGIWISDLSDDRLSTGADFVEMRLDRDRVAALRRSDIDHKISSMWARAILERSDLLPRYYELLAAEDAVSDVSFAELYCDDYAAQKIAQEFHKLHGDGAVPMTAHEANNSAAQLWQLREILDRTTVVCSSALLAVLKKSGAVRTDVAALLEEGIAGSKCYVPEEELSTEERSCIAHASALTKIASPEFEISPANIDVVEFPPAAQPDRRCWITADSGGKVADGGTRASQRFEICRTLLRREDVHASLPQKQCLNPDLGESCLCCESELARALMQQLSQSDLPARRLMASLTASSCKMLPPACAAAHIAVQANPPLHMEREVALRKRISNLEEQLASERSQHASEVQQLQKQLREIEKEVAAGEFRLMDARDAARVELEGKLAGEMQQLRGEAEREHAAATRAEMERERAQAWAEKQLRELREQLQAQREVSERRAAETCRRMDRLQAVLVRRCELLQVMVQQLPGPLSASVADSSAMLGEGAEFGGRSETADVVLQGLREIRDQFREEASKNLCCVCAEQPSHVVLLPCRHKQLCGSCAGMVSRCPICRAPIRERVEVFE